MIGRGMSGPHPEYARQFFFLGIGIVILALGLTTLEMSLAILTFIMYLAILVLVLYYNSINRPE